VCTLHGLPLAFALTGAKAVDREVLAELLAVEPALIAARPGQLLIADKNYYGREFEGGLGALGVRLLRPARKGEPQRASGRLFKPLRQLIESSTRPSRASSTSSGMAVTRPLGCGFGSCSASSPSPRRSGTPTPPASQPCGP
jgi:hypothetical protein